MATTPRKTLPSFVFVVSALLLLLVMIQSQGADARSGIRIRRCGERSRTFTQLVCKYSGFDFPFRFDQTNLILSKPLPSRKRYPFQFQAGKCCKIGCSISEYRWMCDYHRQFIKCQKYGHPRSRGYWACRNLGRGLSWPKKV